MLDLQPVTGVGNDFQTSVRQVLGVPGAGFQRNDPVGVSVDEQHRMGDRLEALVADWKRITDQGERRGVARDQGAMRASCEPTFSYLALGFRVNRVFGKQ